MNNKEENKYTFFGVVHPERANVKIPKVEMKLGGNEAGIDGGLTVWISLSKITAIFVSEQPVDDPHTLKNYVDQAVRVLVDAVGFCNGCGYDIEIIQMVDSSDNTPLIFDVGIPALQDRAQNMGIEVPNIVNLFADRRGIYLQSCFADFREAIRSPKDTGFFCFRAIEDLRQFFVVEKKCKSKQKSWECLRNDLGVDRSTIEEVQDFSDPVRHGESIYISGSDRSTILTKTQDIIGKFIAYADRGYSKQ